LAISNFVPEHGIFRPRQVQGKAGNTIVVPNHRLTAAKYGVKWSSSHAVACRCGVVFERWVAPQDAELDLLNLVRLN
jgi:hypothetical protein